MGDIAWVSSSASAIPAAKAPVRHSALVRVTHWITTLCFFALLISGLEILISHPRFYWGETGNINMTPLFKIPIPSSRALVPTGYLYVLPDQNGWSRYLHFQAAWILVLTGILYILYSLFTGHLQKDLFPRKADFSWRVFSNEIASHLRFARPPAAEAWSYNLLQRIAYLFVILVLFPLVIWTGLAMSPAFVSAVPACRHRVRRPAIRTHHSLLRHRGSGAVPADPRSDDRPSRILDPHPRHDHRPRRHTYGAHMTDLSRRKLITTGLAAAAGVTGLGVAASIAQNEGLVPPDHGGIYGLGETLTYARPASADSPLVSPRIPAQPDFEPSARQ